VTKLVNYIELVIRTKIKFQQ